MLYIDIAQLAAFLGVPTAVTGLFFWLLKRRIDKREDERAEIERARKELDVALIKGVNAAIALGEATAKAVQRIPDAHCNGVRPLDELRDERGTPLRLRGQAQSEGFLDEAGRRTSA